MRTIHLSFVQALYLAKSLNYPLCVRFSPRPYVYFQLNHVSVKSNYVSIVYAKKWYPAIFGNNAYRNYYLSSMIPF